MNLRRLVKDGTLADANLTGNAYLVLLTLAYNADRDGIVSMTQAELTAATNRPRVTVRTALTQLIEHDLLAVVRPGTGRTATTYRVTLGRKTAPVDGRNYSQQTTPAKAVEGRNCSQQTGVEGRFSCHLPKGNPFARGTVTTSKLAVVLVHDETRPTQRPLHNNNRALVVGGVGATAPANQGGW